jgi:rare lipoprotein A (peptidoglycan hydrolase)
MTLGGSRELRVTETIPSGRRAGIRQHLISVIVLSVAFYSNLAGKAHACSASSGQTGVASWYGPGMQGNRTANGETFDMWAMTAAHPCLPLGTKIRVTVLETGRSLIVTVNDRMPSRRRVLDLSIGAARALGIASFGVAVVQLSPT